MKTPRSRSDLIPLLAALPFLTALPLTACDQQTTTNAAGQKLSPAVVRIGQTYPECAAGKFLVLADLESAEQAKLFRIVGPDGTTADAEQPSISILRNRNETGAGGLKAPLRGPDDRLLLDGSRTDQIALIRDWSAQHVLLVSVYGPDDGTALEFSITSGVDSPARWSATLRLRAGWNTLRLDLAEIGDYIDLRDVRQLGWRLPEITSPTELYLDDLLIADNTRYTLGEKAAAGDLFVYSQGRRTMVGAAERFEVGFAAGVLSVLNDEAGQNLALRTGMGPLPIPLSADWSAHRDNPPSPDDPRNFAAWGMGIATSQNVVESSPFRVVVQTQRRYAGSAAEADAKNAEQPSHTWRYAIYPNGRIFVRVKSEPAEQPWPAPRIGYAVAFDGRRDFLRIKAENSANRGNNATFTLLSRAGDTRTDLLWTPHVASLAEQQLELTSIDEHELAVVAGDAPAEGVVDTAHLLVVWPRDLDAAPQAASLAADYQRPARVQVATGELLKQVNGDLNHDGFNESEGLYEIDLSKTVARFRVDPEGLVRHTLLFRIHGTEGRRCWIYADGRILTSQGRDAAGQLMFALPRPLSGPVGIEVNCAP